MARWFTAQAQAAVDSAGAPVVTVSVALPHRNLVFFREDGQFVCRYRLRIVSRLDGKPLDGQEWSGVVQVESYDQTRSPATQRRVVQVRLPPELSRWLAASGGVEGKRRATADLELSVQIDGTERIGRRVLPLTPVVAQRQGIVLAEPVLYALRDAGTGGALRGDTLLVLPTGEFPDPDAFTPRDGLSYDLSTGPVWLLLAVFDLRDTPADSHRVHLSVLPQGQTAARWSATITLPAGKPTARALVRLPSSALAFGANEVHIELPPAAPRQLRVENYGLDVADDASWAANVELVAPLAQDDDELRQLRSAPPAARAAAWDEFWRRRDPDPLQPGNPSLEAHYRRVEYARRELRDGFRDGAVSDRGRVYIRYGPPDSIESRGMLSSSTAAYEVWQYYQSGLAFYFRDADGLGHFRLVWREQR